MLKTKMHLIVYTSEYTGDPLNFDADLLSIVTSAKRNNQKRNVTGAIFYHQGRFLEFVEGTKRNVRGLIVRIQRDPRHRNMQFLFDEAIETRGFSEWHLDVFQLSSHEPLDANVLKVIGDAYKRNFVTASDMLLEVYRSFLENHVVG